MKYRLDEIKIKILKSINSIFSNDRILFKNSTSERNIAQRLSMYIGKEFPEWDIDCEYNRKVEEVKRLEIEGKKHRIFPDIIVHHRATKDNILIIEIKKAPPNNIDDVAVKKDMKRVCKLTIDPDYKYQYGLFILFYVGENTGKAPFLKYFQEGKEV